MKSQQDDIQDGKARDNLEDQDNVECPNVCQTTLADVNFPIEAMTREMLTMQPLLLTE